MNISFRYYFVMTSEGLLAASTGKAYMFTRLPSFQARNFMHDLIIYDFLPFLEMAVSDIKIG